MSIWDTPGLVDLLVSLWDQGRTGTEIANTIEVRFQVLVTRSAVMAKLDRLGKLGTRPNAKGASGMSRAQKEAIRRKAVKTVAEKAAVVAPANVEPPPQGWFAIQNKPVEVKPYVERPLAYMPPAEQMLTIHDLEDHHCRFPIHDPRTPEFRYCGGVKVLSLPYCAEHCRIAYATPEVAPAHEEVVAQPVAVKREVVDA